MDNKQAKNQASEWTEIVLRVGDTSIPAVLNDCQSAKALISRLPCTVSLHRYEHDYCGVMRTPLPYDQHDLRSGWANGDIAFAVDGDYFAILYKDEEISQQFDGLVTMGKLMEAPSVMETLNRQIDVRIERAS